MRMRGTAVGTLFGAVPGTGLTITTFIARALERKIARNPERFGHGAIEGVAVFVQHPICAGFVGISALLISARLFFWVRSLRSGEPADGAAMIRELPPG
jgi:hypothetical protein